MTDRQSARIALVREFHMRERPHPIAPDVACRALLAKLDALDASGDDTPNEAEIALAKSLWQRMAALTEKPDDWPAEWEPISQALAAARSAGVDEGLEKAAMLLTLRQGNGAAIRRIGYDRAARMIRALKGTK